MFESKLDKQIASLRRYLGINDVIYEESLIKEKIDEFNEYYYDKNIMNSMKRPGFELYTDEYVHQKKIELYEELFEEFPGLNDVAKMLKLVVLERSGRRAYMEADMTFGKEKHRLTIPEMLYNEEKARARVESLEVLKKVGDRYKK